jgi:hypothetical protein
MKSRQAPEAKTKLRVNLIIARYGTNPNSLIGYSTPWNIGELKLRLAPIDLGP